MNNKKEQDGGKFVGEGTYGCVLHPAPRCMVETTVSKHTPKKKTTAMLGKIFAKEKDVQTEWDLAHMLSRIDPKQQYFLYPSIKCETTMAHVRQVSGALKCSNLVNQPDNHTVTVLKLPHGGITLEEWVLKEMVPPETFLRMLIPVVHGMQRLARHGIVHHDLKFNNLVVNPKTKECRIIDFGLMVTSEKALSFANPYLKSTYWLHPPEYRLMIDYATNGWLPIQKKDQIRASLLRNLNLYRLKFRRTDPWNLSEQLLNGRVFTTCDYENEYVAYIHSINRKQTPKKMLEYMQSFPQKIDVYSLGVTCLYLSMYMNIMSLGDDKSRLFYELLQGMLHPHPRKRFSCRKIIQILQMF